MSDSPLAFHRALPEYRPTPLRELPTVAQDLGVAQVLVKDESERLGLSSFKVLGASWATERALRQRPGLTTLIAASAGNHGLAVAHTAARRNLDCRIYLPAGAAAARAARIAATGALLIRVDGDYDAAVAAAQQAADIAPDAALIADVSDDPAALVPRWVIDGYGTLFAEITEAGAEADIVLVPAGVGSLAAAAVIWADSQPSHPAVIAVEPRTAACVAAALAAWKPVRVPTPGTTMAGLDCGTVSAVAWPFLAAGLSGAVSVTDEAVHQAMRDLHREGLEIGDCGAAPLAALRTARVAIGAIGASGAGRVLLLATEGITDPDSYHAIVTSPDPIPSAYADRSQR